MFLYTAIEAIVGVVAGILIAVCTKKAEGVTYSKLDKIGQVTNILLLLFYVGFSFFLSAFGCNSNPRHDVSGNSRMDRSNYHGLSRPVLWHWYRSYGDSVFPFLRKSSVSPELK